MVGRKVNTMVAKLAGIVLVFVMCLSVCSEVPSPAFTIGNSGGEFTASLDGDDWLRFTAPRLGGFSGETQIEDLPDEWRRVRMTWSVEDPVQQDELSIPFDVLVEPDQWWAPHLAPEEGFCIAQHVFRSPAMIATRGDTVMVVVPDLDIAGDRPGNPWFMDYDALARTMWLGMTRTSVPLHVLYKKEPGMVFEPGAVELGFFVTLYKADEEPLNPWARVTQFLWERYGHPLYLQGEPLRVPMDTYINHTYRWAFDSWKDSMWHEFEIDGETVGGPAFIVNVSQSPNYPGPWFQRELLSIWNQAWFSTLRVGAGMRRYAVRTENADLLRRAELVKAFTLSAPQEDGLFPAVYRTDNEKIEVDGATVERPRPWSEGYWANSNRVPWKSGVTDRWFHVLDASWTALLMLRWYDEFEKDPALLEYATTYADRLLTLQDADGFFPAWLHPETDEPWEHYRQSPEISMSVTFLLKLADVTDNTEYRDAALRAMDAVVRDVIPTGRWEDFETYFSCCQWGYPEFLNRQIPRNAMYKQNNFSMFWTAEALLESYRVTGNDAYLRWGRRTLDELSMTQQVWQPPFIHIPALGGFGVMNCDGEWNDSRECLFAELFMDYYQVTGDPHLFERGVAALKSAFVMMYCPENPEQRSLYEKVHPFFGPEDYGFTMENYGHGGTASREGEGIGPFTIFSWGNGAAAEARNRIRDHWGDVYVDRTRGKAFGIDSVAVELHDGELRLEDLANKPRQIRICYENGASIEIDLNGATALTVD